MKKKLLASLSLIPLIIVLVLAGCGNTNNLENLDERLMEEFTNIAENAPSIDVIIEAVDLNISKVSTKIADEMLNVLEGGLERDRAKREDRIFELDKDNELMQISGNEIVFNEARIEEIKNEDLKSEVKALYKNLYKLQNVEGNFYPIIDYEKLRRYDKYASEEWKSYLLIKSLDSEDRPMSDGGLTISFGELADRILKTEGHLKTFVDGQRQEEMIETYENKLNAYLKGLPNTPIGDYETKYLRKDVLESYRNVANQQGDITASIVYEYIEAIEENDYIIDEKINDKADSLIKKALEEIKELQ